MPRCDGVQATRRLRDSHPEIKVLVLTTFSDDRTVLDALRAGARGYLTKDAGGAEIREALVRVRDNLAAIDPAVQHHLVTAVAGARPCGSHAARGRGARAHRRGAVQCRDRRAAVITEATVKTHINHLLAKTGVRDRAQAVIYAYEQGILRSKP